MRGQALLTSPHVSLPSPSLSSSSATSRSRSAMSQRTSTRPGVAVICRYESLALWASADEPASQKREPRAAARITASQRRERSEHRIDPPIVKPERRLQPARFLDRVTPPARARRFREDEQIERLALLADVAPRERERALGVAVDREREHGLLAAVKDARLGSLVGERDPLSHLADIALAARRIRPRRRDREAQQHGVGAGLVLQHGERLAGPLLRDQEVGIGNRRVGV